MHMKTYPTQAFIREQTARCLLCHDAPCTAACPNGQDPAGFIRSLRFLNSGGAVAKLQGCSCAGGTPPCEAACIHYDGPIPIQKLHTLTEAPPEQVSDVDLSIDFCGFHCENPFFLSSSVVASNYEMCARALESGWAGVVFKTIGILHPEEVSPRFYANGKEGTPFVGFRNLEQIAEHPLKQNLAWLAQLKKDFPDKVIVASIMGQTEDEWTQLAEMATEAGVDIIECNFSCPHMSGGGLGSDVGQQPDVVKRYTEATRKGTHLPILAKMTPNVGHIELPAQAAVEGGADGLAAINTVKSISGLDLDSFAALPAVDGLSSVSGYSGSAIKPIALRFIHDMAAYPATAVVPLSGMGGIETWRDAAEFLLLGCSNLQVTTAVMQYGYRMIDDLTDGLARYIKNSGFERVADMVGRALPNLVPTDQLDRKTLVYPRFNRERCVGCGRCFISCEDAGHQAIRWDAEMRTPSLIGKNCVGCHLCLQVCPVSAIGQGKRVPKPV